MVPDLVNIIIRNRKVVADVISIIHTRTIGKLLLSRNIAA